VEVAVGEGGCCISSTVVRYWNVAAKVMDGGGGGDSRHFRMTSVNHTNTLFFFVQAGQASRGTPYDSRQI